MRDLLRDGSDGGAYSAKPDNWSDVSVRADEVRGLVDKLYLLIEEQEIFERSARLPLSLE